MPVIQAGGGTIPAVEIDFLLDAANAFATPPQLQDLLASTTSLQAQFSKLAAKAQGGDLAALQALPDAGSAAADSVRSNATDRVSMMRALAQIKSASDKAAAAAEGKVSEAQSQADALQKQIDALNGVNDNTSDMATLLANMQSATQAAD